MSDVWPTLNLPERLHPKLNIAHNHWKHRQITELIWPAPEYQCISIEDSEYDLILPYSESGEMAHVIWFEVHCVNGDTFRVNGSSLSRVAFREITDY